MANTKNDRPTAEMPQSSPKKRERKAALVLPPYSLKSVKTGDSLFIRVLSEITNKPDIDQKTGVQKIDKQGKPAELHLVDVTDLDTGAVGQMVLPFIIHKAFLEYIKVNDAFVGAEFELVKGKAESNKATLWEVYELK